MKKYVRNLNHLKILKIISTIFGTIFQAFENISLSCITVTKQIPIPRNIWKSQNILEIKNISKYLKFHSVCIAKYMVHNRKILKNTVTD